MLLVKGGEDGFIPSNLEVRDRGVMYSLHIRKLLCKEGGRKEMNHIEFGKKVDGSLLNRCNLLEVEDDRALTLQTGGNNTGLEQGKHGNSGAPTEAVSYAHIVGGSMLVGPYQNLNFESGQKQLEGSGAHLMNSGPVMGNGPCISKVSQRVNLGLEDKSCSRAIELGKNFDGSRTLSKAQIDSGSFRWRLDQQKGSSGKGRKEIKENYQVNRGSDHSYNDKEMRRLEKGVLNTSRLKQGVIYSRGKGDMEGGSSSSNRRESSDNEEEDFFTEERETSCPETEVSMHQLFDEFAGKGEQEGRLTDNRICNQKSKAIVVEEIGVSMEDEEEIVHEIDGGAQMVSTGDSIEGNHVSFVPNSLVSP